MRTVRTGVLIAAALLTVSSCASAEDLASPGQQNSGDSSSDSPSTDTDEPTEESPSDESPSEEETEETEKPSAPVPKVGECRRLKAGDIASGTVPVGGKIKCGKRHNAETMYVTKAKGKTKKALRNGNINKVYEQTRQKCSNKLSSWTGGGSTRRERTSYGVVVGAPSQKDVELGATWIRCDIVLYHPGNGRPTYLPKKTKGSMSARTSEVDFCMVNKKGSKVVLCRKPHRFRSVGVVRLGGPSAKFPGVKKVQSTMRSRCLKQARQFLGKNRYTRWTFPNKRTWPNGDRYGECYARTRK